MKLLFLCTAVLYCSVAGAVPVAVPAPFPGGKIKSFIFERNLQIKGAIVFNRFHCAIDMFLHTSIMFCKSGSCAKCWNCM